MTSTREQIESADDPRATDGQPPGRAAVVINPSKVVDLDHRRREITAALADAGWAPPLWLTTTPEDPGCGQTREAIDAGVDVVLACGGDGTVMAVVTELAGSDVALAVIPSGTGNLLAANLALPTDVTEAVRVATGGIRRRIDVGVLDKHHFTVMAGMGFDAVMLDGTPDRWKARIGWPAYVVSALRHLRERPMRVRIRLDDGPRFNRRARSVIVANVGKLQGGVPLLPDARPDDGCLDVAVLRPGSLAGWALLAWDVLRRRPHPRRIETFRARRVEVRANRTEAREVDGDVIEPGRDLTVSVRAGALWICVPPPG